MVGITSSTSRMDFVQVLQATPWEGAGDRDQCNLLQVGLVMWDGDQEWYLEIPKFWRPKKLVESMRTPVWYAKMFKNVWMNRYE